MFPTADTEDIVQVTSQKRKTGDSSDGQNSPENIQVKQNNRDLTLNMLIKEIVFCIALALTTYGALHNSPTKISKHPQAMRFFDEQSVVTDWYRGELSSALAAINNNEISFVMYYAPWDAESQFVRGEFEKSAVVLGDRVHFAAINCWHPGSECRLQHSKIPAWPILIAYTVRNRGIVYKGPMDAQSMVKFLQLIMQPLERVSTTEDLVTLLSICDVVAVGYTPLSDTSRFYNIWYYVALKALEFDTIGEICFATVTSENFAAELGVEKIPNARIMRWNDTLDYVTSDTVRPWNETALLQWVLESFSQPVARVIPMWKKAFSFERYVDGNPILILFTPLNPLYEQLPAYSLLREVAMEYYNCNANKNESSHWISKLIKLQQVQRLMYQKKNIKKDCQDNNFLKSSHNSYRVKKDIISNNNKYPWNNNTQKSKKSGMLDFLFKKSISATEAHENFNEESDLWTTLAMLHQCDTNIMPPIKSIYGIYDQCEKNDESGTIKQSFTTDIDYETSMLLSEEDPLSTDNLVQAKAKLSCKLFEFANKLSPPVIPAKIQFETVDSVRNHHFAESLGIDVTKKKDMTAIVILDSKQETQYILAEEYNAKSIRDFIYNFTYKNLKRSLRTHVDDALHTHYFESDSSTRSSVNSTIVEVIDLTTKTFRKMVRTPGDIVIVAVCGGSCTASTSRALVESARLLSGCGLHVRPARLDALRHDLPWHYTAHYYPTILVFPADRSHEAESKPYPASERITSSGLVALALRSLGPSLHLRVRLELCAKAKMAKEKRTCLKDMREHVTTVILRNLKYWRQTEQKKLKDAFLKRLQHLHRVSLELSLLHISDLTKNSDGKKKILNSLSVLTDSWDIDPSLLRINRTSSIKSAVWS
ncbi:hypothetical protein ACJJTC_013163 [Scirpophaga incertulas]